MMRRFILLSLIASFIFLSFASAITWDNFAYYNLDQGTGTTATDVSGNGRTGTLSNDIAWTPLSKLGPFAIRSASNGNISIADNAQFTNGNLTLSVWFNSSNSSCNGGVDCAVISKWNDAGVNQRSWMLMVRSGVITVLRSSDGTATTQMISQGIIANNSWNHVAVTFNGTHIGLWVNGSHRNMSTFTGFFDNTESVRIASQGGATSPGFNGIIDEVGFWNRSLSVSEIGELYNSGAGATFPAAGLITVTLVNPANNTNQSSSIVFNTTVIPGSGVTLTNLSQYIWHSNGSLFNQSFITLSGTTQTNALITVNDLPAGSYRWNVLAMGTNSTGVSSDYSDSNYTFSVVAGVISNTWNYFTYETASERFVTNVTLPSGNTLSSASLIWNGTSYAGTVSFIAGRNYSLSRTIDMPLNSGNASWYWLLNYASGGSDSTSSNNQNVSAINLTSCTNAPMNVAYINFTFRDEVTNAITPASIDSSTWSYYLGSGTVNKTFSYSNSTTLSSYSFCFSPASRTVNSAINLKYSATNYPQRTYYPSGSIALTNSTLQQTLYMLGSSDGLYVTIQVINVALQNLQDAFVNITRSDIGYIGSGFTDSSGAVTFWLNPNFLHDVYVSKSGYPSDSSSITPTQSLYTITLGDNSTASSINDTTRGITLSFAPSGLYLDNNTVYSFNLTLGSSYWDLDSFGFVLYNSSGALIGTNSSSSSTGGTVSLNANTGTNTSIVMDAFWIIDGQRTNFTHTWVIFDNTGTGSSIKTFITHLSSYLTNGGLFGLQKGFGLNIIIFIVIIGTTGILTYKFGFGTPIALAILFVMTFLFDAGFGLIQNPPSAVDNFASFITFLMLVAGIVREALQ